MADSLIGLHIYTIFQKRNRKSEKIEFSDEGAGALLKEYCSDFFRKYSEIESDEEEVSRLWFFDPRPNNGASFHGLIKYGSSGFESDIIDRKTREVQYERSVSDVEIIPLYYRLWVPSSGECALLALQTYGQRSCVGRVQYALETGFRMANKGYRLELTPFIPAQLAMFRQAPVKSFSLLKRNYSSDSAENQIGTPNDAVELSVSFNAKRRKNLGLFKELADRITSSKEKTVLNYNNTDFDEAVAEVAIGGRRRRITMIGVSQNAGKLDLTDDVKRGPNGHPKFQSISDAVEELFSSIMEESAS